MKNRPRLGVERKSFTAISFARIKGMFERPPSEIERKGKGKGPEGEIRARAKGTKRSRETLGSEVVEFA